MRFTGIIAGLLACLTVAFLLQPRSHDIAAVPIEQAIHLSDQEAQRWRPGAELQFVTSQDTDMDLQDRRIPGTDGRRRAWVLQYVDPRDHHAILIQVWDGKAKRTAHEAQDEGVSLKAHEVRAVGRLLTKSADKNGLLPGEGWARGYHFRLEYDYTASQHVIAVFGVDRNGERHALTASARTGNILSATGH